MANEYRNKTINFIRGHEKGIKIFIFALLVGGMVFRGLMQIPHIRAGREEITRLESQIEYEKQRQNEITALRERVNTDEYIEKIASERLGLIKSNAKIFVDVSGEQQ